MLLEACGAPRPTTSRSEAKAWDARFDDLFTGWYWLADEGAPTAPIAQLEDETRRSLGDLLVALATACVEGAHEVEQPPLGHRLSNQADQPEPRQSQGARSAEGWPRAPLEFVQEIFPGRGKAKRCLGLEFVPAYVDFDPAHRRTRIMQVARERTLHDAFGREGLESRRWNGVGSDPRGRVHCFGHTVGRPAPPPRPADGACRPDSTR